MKDATLPQIYKRHTFLWQMKSLAIPISLCRNKKLQEILFTNGNNFSTYKKKTSSSGKKTKNHTLLTYTPYKTVSAGIGISEEIILNVK